MSKRLGMTLVELLVVIVIVALLAGLLLPAVQASRESARSTTCRNNLKQLALATQHFHQACGTLPTYWWQPNPNPNVSAVTTQAEGGWLMNLLPQLDQSAAYSKMAASYTSGFGYTNQLIQPASADYQPAVTITPAVYGPLPPQVWIPPTTQTQTGTTSSGVGHGHQPIGVSTIPGHWYQPPAPVISPAVTTPAVGTPAVYKRVYYTSLILTLACCPSDSLSSAAAGAGAVVANAAAPSGGSQAAFSLTNYQANYQALVLSSQATTLPLPYDYLQCTSSTFGNIRDGLSNTILFAEGARLCSGSYRLAFWNSYLYQHSHNFGVDWNGNLNTAMFQSISDPAKCNNWRLQGLHRGVLNVALADGSTRSLSPSIDHAETSDPNNPQLTSNTQWITMRSTTGVWDRLVLPNDGQVVGDF